MIQGVGLEELWTELPSASDARQPNRGRPTINHVTGIAPAPAQTHFR